MRDHSMIAVVICINTIQGKEAYLQPSKQQASLQLVITHDLANQ